MSPLGALLVGLALAGGDVEHKAGEGLLLQAQDSPAEVLLGAWVQPAVGLTLPGFEGGLDVRRARLSVSARPTETLRAELGLGLDRLEPRVVDAHGSWSPNKALRVRVGRMRPPSGLERETSARLVPFLERSGVQQLVPGRTEALELRLRHGPASLSLAAARGAAEDPWLETRAVDLVGSATLRGEAVQLGLRGGLLARPEGAQNILDEAPDGTALLSPRAWAGWGSAAGASVVGVLGPVRLAAEGAGVREGTTLGTADAHTLHGAGYVLVGVAPGAARGGLGDSAAVEQGWEWTARVDGRIAAPAPGVGSAGWWAGARTGLAWTPTAGTRLSAEAGPTWVRPEGAATATPTFAAMAVFTVGL